MDHVEFDFVVGDSQAAAAYYQQVFADAFEPIQVTAWPRGLNEAIFNLFGTRFHLLDENPEYGLTAPVEGTSHSSWVNLTVPDLRAIWDRAMAGGATEIQPITVIAELGIMNAAFLDPFSHVWLLHQITDPAAAADVEAHQAYLEDRFGPPGAAAGQGSEA